MNSKLGCVRSTIRLEIEVDAVSAAARMLPPVALASLSVCRK